MQEWRLVNSGNLSGALNMAIDEAIAQTVAAGIAPPTLRFYGWEPPCLTLGYAQREAEMDWGACAAQGISVVRRLTGGRAVLHHQEVTYSIAAPENNPVVSGTILESYLKISRGLLLGLQKLGLDAQMVFRKDTAKLRSAACFDSPSFYEMLINGKKAVGSAQTRKNGVLLQHGSIIREMNVDLLFSVLNFSSEETRLRLKQAFLRKACSLQQAVGRELTDNEIISAVTEGFAEVFKVRLVNLELTPEEMKTAEDLVLTKYGRDDWNRKR